VPTMGSLHEGHYALIDAARRECDFVVVSIFVNPTQFGPGEDYERYPRPLEADLAGCESHGVDAVFAPSADAMYAPGFATTVHVEGLTTGLCGRSRPGHFDGVTTVVAKLLNIVLPDVAYFGAKDYQQAAVVRRMAADLNMPLRVEVCPTVREADGLAMSSRNAYLTAEEARRAPLGRIDYVEIVDPDSLQNVQTIDGPVVAALAVRFPSARLIDNMRIDPPGSSG